MKPDNTQETIYVGLDTGLPPYLPYPRFLLKMDISQTAKLLYALLLDRTTLSQRNGWQDDQGRTFIVYPIAEIAEMLDKGQTAIKAALNELDAAGLLERKRAGFSAANRLYVKLPPLVRISDPMTVGKATLISAENRPCALPGFVDSKNEEKTERNAGYLVVSHSGGGMLRQGTRKGIRRTPANRGMRAHRIVKSLDISEDVCHGLCP